MADIFQYDFMRKAFLVGILLAIIIPCIGLIIVFKRLSMIGDALSHTSLAGVGAGLVAGVNPVVGAIVFCILASFSIEAIRKRIPQYAEMSIAIVMSAGIGLAGVFSGMVKNSASFNNFLFGSILVISDFETVFIAVLSCVVLLSFILLYKELFLISFDERSARLAGVPVAVVNFLFTLLTAVTVSAAARTVGALIVSSMMVVPVACAMQFGKSYFQTLLYSIAFALLFTVVGLFVSYETGLKPGSTIVLIGVIILVFILLLKKVVVFVRGLTTQKPKGESL